MDNKSEIANRLEKWILENYKTKTAFCKDAGMSLQSLNIYTSGVSGIGNKFLKRLRELGCDVDWLITGREAPLHQATKVVEDKTIDNLLLVEFMNRVITLENEDKKLKEELRALKNELKAARLEKAGHAVAK